MNVDFRLRTVFIVGQTNDIKVQNKLADENLLHGDLLQERFMDAYNNLTLKTMMMIKWVNHNCIGKGISSERFVFSDE